jgi:hypothetical protein
MNAENPDLLAASHHSYACMKWSPVCVHHLTKGTQRCMYADVVTQRPGPLRGALQHSNSSLLLKLVRVLDAPGLRLEGLRRWRLWDHARLP